ncbi:MAG: type III-B CRISPR module-associated protein Cmr5 [Fusobacterium sp. JB019]|nr:type III-B CRISPR module-associated protein Cmr5 [Fusobacterium sp. JB019]
MINKKKVEEYIPKVIKLIEEEFKDSNKGLPKELTGYITSFGAAIIQSGLIPAVAFYEREESNGSDETSKNRKKLMRIIGKLLYEDFKQDNLLLEKLIDEHNKIKKDDIINASVAIKLVIRLYKKLDETGDINE